MNLSRLEHLEQRDPTLTPLLAQIVTEVGQRLASPTPADGEGVATENPDSGQTYEARRHLANAYDRLRRDRATGEPERQPRQELPYASRRALIDWIDDRYAPGLDYEKAYEGEQ